MSCLQKISYTLLLRDLVSHNLLPKTPIIMYHAGRREYSLKQNVKRFRVTHEARKGSCRLVSGKIILSDKFSFPTICGSKALQIKTVCCEGHQCLEGSAHIKKNGFTIAKFMLISIKLKSFI